MRKLTMTHLGLFETEAGTVAKLELFERSVKNNVSFPLKVGQRLQHFTS